MPWAAVGAAAGAIGSAAVSSALAPNPNIPGATATRGPPSFLLNTPSFNETQNSPFSFNVGQSQGVTDQLGNLAQGVGTANDAITQNINSLTPGFGAITQARVNAIANAASKATSDLQGNLASRRVLGSSFGQNAVSQVTQQAGVDTANAQAQSYLEELQQQTSLINQRLNNVTALANQELSQANFNTTAGINLVNGTQQTFQDNAAVIGQLAAANASGTGAFLQQSGLSGQISNGVQSLGSLVGGAGGGGGGASGGAASTAQLNTMFTGAAGFGGNS